jgi:hypothetical protein
MRHLGVCYKTTWLMKHKRMEILRLREYTCELDRCVEIGNTYPGGERSGGKIGRASENKVPFVPDNSSTLSKLLFIFVFNSCVKRRATEAYSPGNAVKRNVSLNI